MTTIDVDTVCTHTDLVDELGSRRELQALVPPEQNGSTELYRRKALEDVLSALARRTPPIFGVSDPTELRNAVAYGALMRLYRIAMVHGGEEDAHALRYRAFKKLFETEIASMRISTAGGSNAGPQTLSVFRS